MAMAASLGLGKRLRPRQDISYGPQAPQAKRQRTTPKLELLQDQVKEESQLLDSYLTQVLKYLPTDDSALAAQEFIESTKYFLDIANSGHALRETAAILLEIDLDTVLSGIVKPSE
jgi:hypothetical protein